MQPCVLIIEDEAAIAMAIVDALEDAGMRPLAASDLATADRHLQAEVPAAVVLDRMLPDGEGVAWLQRRRQAGWKTPVLVLSARCDENARCQGLEQGADDYLAKPFSPRELVARVSALLRRLPHEECSRFRLAGVDIDLDARTVDGVALSDHEYALLRWCWRQRGRTVTRQELLSGIWGFAHGPAGPTRAVDMCVAGLRRKLGPAAVHLVTVRGGGYRLDTADD